MTNWHASKVSYSPDATDALKQNSPEDDLSAPPSTRATQRSSDTEDSNPEWRFEGSKQLTEMSHSRTYVSVLLLEKLGDTLQMEVPLGDELV